MPKTIKLYKIRKRLLSMHIFSAFTGVGQCLTNFGSSYPSLSASSDLAASLGGGGIGVPSSGNLTPVSAPSPSLTSHTSLPAPSLTTFGFTQVLFDFLNLKASYIRPKTSSNSISKVSSHRIIDRFLRYENEKLQN